ncbi:MBOAT family O-acyltransferase [Hydrocarboniclastica marina]|uniref:Probable alginate O-acetylase n=1 Tax=Hydrocarboniclastica marina TaxID=2259620 RepID=A0A4P7XH11_9ALTE|nr:MBOAT family O-acyltransferase [Hydrocarboniclastica marina]QCF26015.1 MBOAT family protein [Hydrocarboniclastica marina]
MIFTSNIFIFIYLPVFLAIYYGVKDTWRSHVIVFGSYLFYAWWRPDFLLLFVGITYWNYYFGIKINRLRDIDRKLAFRWLTIGVVGNLATLGYFKYANFGAEALANTLQQFGVNTFTLENIILPLGISFYVFQALSYIVDIYRKDADPTDRFVDFAAFISLFPQLIAGPILRYRVIAEQLRQRVHSFDLFSLGACRFMQGFAKKVLIADSLAPINTYFLSISEPTMAEVWLGCVGSLFQLYFDFSGYSDMAIGLGMMMGFRFAENFNQPFNSMSLTEFWKRWHLTLSEFLRDYVFIPIAKTNKVGTDTAAFTTMFLSGLWHGASFSFIFFGVYFGFFMLLERRLGLTTRIDSPYRPGRHIIAMIMVVLSMPLFVTGDLGHSIELYAGAFGFNGVGSIDNYLYATSSMTMAFLVIAIIWLVVTGVVNRRFYDHDRNRYFMQHVAGWQAGLLWFGFSLAVTKLAANTFSPFLYFQF